ncbi:multidrug effflux MFS transporter [Latilactobacillus sakei]|uniref:multidrug effflux MFS transporter n=1 Tax=Latilactobacillus sakei TaxID=1599 RepID=UPI0039B12404
MKNVSKKSPSILLMIVLVGFPQISESIFTPVLPMISRAFHVSAQTAQLTMSTYFMAFAFGVLFWGWLSDQIGRRLTMLLGIGVYLLGNGGLLLAGHFSWLILARLVQAFGASVGSVVTQTIMRESFSGVRGAQVFAKVGAAMVLAPALGPLIGGLVQTYFGYRQVFSVLIMMAVGAILYAGACLPETRPAGVPAQVNIGAVTKRLLTDKKVWVYGAVISGINGILFSYYAEAPFIFINHFHLSTVQYGWLGLVLAAASILGAMTTNYGAPKFGAVMMAKIGLVLALVGSLLLLVASYYDQLLLMVILILIVFWGLNTTLPVVLNLALVGYEAVIGTASGLFSFGYYLAISALTYGMSLLHTGAISRLPLYIVTIVAVMALWYGLVIRNNEE